MDIYNLEQKIMNCWGTKDDLDLLYHAILDGSVVEDELPSIIIGISTLHELRCKSLFETYEANINQ